MRRAWVAFSGGPDSTALLWLASQQLRPAWELMAVHVDHGLQDRSEAWAGHCRRVCAGLEIPLRVVAVAVEPQAASGLEEGAREARYRALEALLESDDALLTAHHRDDQAETFLIQALRGSGVDGLAAMPEVRPLGEGLHIRPLLAHGRSDLQRVLAASGLPSIDDPMNADTRHERAFLREKLMPMLEERRPGVSEALARSARHCAAAKHIVDAAVAERLDELVGPASNPLSIDALQAHSESLRRELVRGWLRQQGLPLPRERQLEALMGQLDAAPDAEVLVAWPGAEVRRYRGRLFAGPPLSSPDPDTVIDWCARQLELPGGIGRLRWEAAESTDDFPALQVRFRSGGERIRPSGSSCTHELKKLFQDTGIPPWERGRLPLICRGEELLAVADLWQTAGFEKLQSRYGIRLVFVHGSS